VKKTTGATDGEILQEARALVPAFYGLARALRLQGVTEAGLAQLPPSELEVLRYVLDAPGTGVGALARDLGLHASNVSATVRALVARNLVRRDADPHDRRSVQLHPTMDAVHGMAHIEDAWARIFAGALTDLTDEQRAALLTAVPALGALGERLKSRRANTHG
jgi:DNA-binding MarR family transcriptional regulator